MSAAQLRMFNALADAFVDDRIDLVASCFSYPLPMFLEGELQVFGSADTLAEALAMYREASRGLGVRKFQPRIVAEGLAVNGCSCVWVEWDHLDADGNCKRSNQVRYAVRQTAPDQCPTIEMVDYTVTAFPKLLHQHPKIGAPVA